MIESEMVQVGDRVFAKADLRGWLPGVARHYDADDNKFFVEFFDGALELLPRGQVVTEKQYHDVHGYY